MSNDRLENGMVLGKWQIIRLTLKSQGFNELRLHLQSMLHVEQENAWMHIISHNIYCIFNTHIVSIMFIFHFRNIFGMTYYVNINVIDTLFHVGKIKMLHKHTHTLCVHSIWSLDTETELSPLKEIYRFRSTFCTFVDWSLVTPYGDKNLVIIGSGNDLSSVWCQPLPESMMTYCQLEPYKRTSVKLYCKYKYFVLLKSIGKCYQQNGVHFVQALIS